MPNRFDYVKYDDLAAKTQAEFKAKCQELEHLAETHLKNGRAKALLLTKLEEVYMWAGKALRDDQIERGAPAPLMETRGNE